MANIKVKDLAGCSINGADLFNDSESFMRDLSNDELELQGGWRGLAAALTIIVLD